jgi:glycogen synthase
MRVGIFTVNWPGVTGEGGIGSYTRSVAESLRQRGHAVHVFVLGSEPRSEECELASLHVLRHWSVRGVDRFVPELGESIGVWRQIRRIARDCKLELIEFPNWEGLGWLAARRLPLPVVVRLHTSSLEAAEIDGRFASRFVGWDVWREKQLARHATALVTHSVAHARRMAEELDVDQECIEVIPHGIAVPSLSQTRVRPHGEFHVLTVGRLERRKGTLDLLAAIPRVLAAVPHARFTFAGFDRAHCDGGITHEEFARRTLDGAVMRRVEFLGVIAQAELETLYREADVVTAPSHYESFGLTAIEAMRFGTPVVCARGGGLAEVVEDGRSGLLVEVGDVEGLAAALIRLARDEMLREGLGCEAVARVRTEFSDQTMGGRVEDFFRRVISGHARRPSKGPSRG